MYSVVLMMALSGGAATPAFGHRCSGCDCSGCSCSSSCSGWSCSGCSGCHGCHGRSRKGCHGCHGCSSCHGCNGCSGYSSCSGCHGGYGGCYGGGYGCNGGGYGGCYGGGYGGGYGCNGGGYGGCYGGAMVAPGAPMMAPGAPVQPAPKKEETVKPPKAGEGAASAAAPATIVVTLPADAKLMVDDYATTSASANRVFTSPVLEPGKEFSYTFKATIVRDGRELTTSRQVAVRAGEETRVTLEFPVASVAQR